MNLAFHTVDVFAGRAFGGNALAVFPDARGLSDAQMQAIAGEFNLSETTFVLPPRDPANTACVRIFTPRAEMPFAGHPNVGTAFVLAREAERAGRAVAGDAMTFEEKAGLVRMALIRERGELTGATVTAPQPFARCADVPVEAVAAACSLPAEAISLARHAPCIGSCGAVFVFAELKDRAALSAASPRTDVFAERLPMSLATGVHLYVREAADGVDCHTRMFGPLHGVYEDPATGSANVALAALFATLDPRPELDLRLAIAQGVDMGRPSLLSAMASKSGGVVTRAAIGGGCVPMMQGTLTLAE
jgi:trans-2,3-dihydro-3-hydroxyanthranilate isomerase